MLKHHLGKMIGLLAVVISTSTCFASQGTFNWENVKKEEAAKLEQANHGDAAAGAYIDEDNRLNRDRRAKIRTLTNGKNTNCDTYCTTNLKHKFNKETALVNCKMECGNCQVALVRFHKEDVSKITDQQLIGCGMEGTKMTASEIAREKELESRIGPGRPSTSSPTTKPGQGRSGGEIN